MGRKWNGSKWKWPPTRWAIYHRDGFCCVVCGASAEDSVLTLDHVHPVERGGSNGPENLITMCLSCNCAKQDKTKRQWFAWLRNEKDMNTDRLRRRIRRLCRKALNRAEGRRLHRQQRARLAPKSTHSSVLEPEPTTNVV